MTEAIGEAIAKLLSSILIQNEEVFNTPPKHNINTSQTGVIGLKTPVIGIDSD